MHGRCLTRGFGNVSDLDAFIRNNRHYYDIFLYGFSEEKNISMETMMKVKMLMPMKLLFYLRMDEIYNSIKSEISLADEKHMKAELLHSFKLDIALNMAKQIKMNPQNAFKAKLNMVIESYIKMIEMKTSFHVGSLNNGKVIADIEHLTLSDIANQTIEQLCAGIDNVYGLRLGLVRPRRVKDIENLLISQIEDITVDELCYIRIY